MNLVPTPATQHVAKLMMRTTLRDTPADAVLRHLPQLEPQQVPALLALVLRNAKINQKPGRQRLPDLFSAAERRRGYASYKRGDRSDWAVACFREYQRHQQRTQRVRRGVEAVDQTFRVSSRPVMLVKDTDVSRPPAALERQVPGASPTRKDTDRLMATVPPPADSAPDAPCPTCGLPGEGHGSARDGVAQARYLCPAGHIWQTTWPAAAEGAA